MKDSLICIVQEAGEKILQLAGDRSFDYKKDYSPVTEADKISHNYLKAALKNLYNIPILSEEEYVPFNIRSQWKEFWLIDPLDGTKEFIYGYDDYCINIALIQNQQPVLGVIYAPKLDELYYAQKKKGFEYRGKPHQRSEQNFIIAISRFHHSGSTEKFMQLNNLVHTRTIGGAIKFGRLALGLLDIYPRFEGSKEWDTAAGHLLLNESKGTMIDLKTAEQPLYNKENIQNNYFLAVHHTVDYLKLQYGDLL